MNANVVVAFNCNFSVALEEICRRLAGPGRTTATRRRRQVSALTAMMHGLIFIVNSNSNNQPNAPQLLSMVTE